MDPNLQPELNYNMKTIRRWIAYKIINPIYKFVVPPYKPPKICDVCGWNEQWHRDFCPVTLKNMTKKDWEKFARKYYKAYRDEFNRSSKFLNKAHFWEGKFNTLRIENNALRKKVTKQNKGI